MLEIPEVGLRLSVNNHNVDSEVLCDWIESSVLFVDEIVSFSDIIDRLCEANIYQQQAFAAEIVEAVWGEIQRRQQWIGKSAAISIEKNRIQRKLSWDQVPAHSFCMAVTAGSYFKRWACQFGSDYTEQGELFELLTMNALEALGWHVYRTGWGRGLQADNFQAIVTSVADCLSETIINEMTVTLYDEAKDEGLDLVCYMPFSDSRGGKPVYLMQCASGENWKSKCQSPNLDIWKRLITFSSDPQRAFAMPFALPDDAFFRACNRVNGMVIDRYRLLSAGKNDPDWMPSELRTRLVTWLKPRIESLPRDDI